MQSPWLRFLVETAIAIALCFALYTLGWSGAAEPMLRFATAPLERLYVDEPVAWLRAQFHIGLVCASPPLFAWVTVLAYRIRTRAHPSWTRLALSLAIPVAAVGLGFVVDLLQTRAALEEASRSTQDLQPLVGLPGLSPAFGGLRFGLVAGLVMFALNVWPARWGRTKSFSGEEAQIVDP